MESIAGQLTAAQVWAALATVAAVLGWSNAVYKNIFGKNLGESLRLSIMKRWFSNAIFKKDVLVKFDHQQLFNNKIEKKIDEILAELKTNGGSTVKDSTIRLEKKVAEATNEIKHLKGLRDAGDSYDHVMRFRYHPERGCTLINEAFLKAFGHYEGRVLGFNFEELVHPEDIADTRLKWNQATNNLTDFRDTQRIKSSMNIYYTCEVMAKAIKDSNGELIEYSGVIEMTTQT